MERLRLRSGSEAINRCNDQARRKTRTPGMCLTLAFCLISFSYIAAEIDAEADRILRAMSDHLASLKAFDVEIEVATDTLLQSGEKIQVLGEGSGTFDRENGFKFDRTGVGGDIQVVFDGETVTVFSPEQNVYASATVEGGPDAALDELRYALGIEAAGGVDLLYANPYEGLNYEVESARYIGEAVIGGAPAHHLAYRAAEVDWQLWVRATGDPLPLRYVITSKWIVAAPQFSVTIRSLEPTIAADGIFDFTPPAGATEIGHAAFVDPETLVAE